MPAKPNQEAVLEAARTLERFGFSNPSATKAAGQIAMDQQDLINLANLLRTRHGLSETEASATADEMLTKKQGWDMYTAPSAGELNLEDPLVRYVTSPEYGQVPAAGKEAAAAYDKKTNPPAQATSRNEVYMQNMKPSEPANPYDERLARAATLRQHILGY